MTATVIWNAENWMHTRADPVFAPGLMRVSRIRLIIAFSCAIAGEIINALWGADLIHLALALVVFAILISQFVTDALHDPVSLTALSAPAVAAIAVLLVIGVSQAIIAMRGNPHIMETMSQTDAMHSMHAMHEAAEEMIPDAVPAAHIHSPPHLVCLASVFILIAKYFEKSARFSASETLAQLCKIDGEPVSATSGGRITVQRSGVVPVDGVLISGETYVEESVLTGELDRINKRAGDVIYCGSVNYSRQIEIEAISSYNGSLYPRIIAAIGESVKGGRSGIRQLLSLLPKILAIIVTIAALGVVFLTYLTSGEISGAALIMITLAVGAVPSTLALFSPLADEIGFSLLGGSGIIIGSPAVAESISLSRDISFLEGALTIDDTGAEREGAAKTKEILEKIGFVSDGNTRNTILVRSWNTLPDDPDNHAEGIRAEGIITEEKLTEGTRAEGIRAEGIHTKGTRAEGTRADGTRVVIGRADEMILSGADVFITHKKITHLLKVIYVCRSLRKNIHWGLAIAAAYHIALIALAVSGVLNPVYAGLMAAASAIGLTANNRRIEIICSRITFDRILKSN